MVELIAIGGTVLVALYVGVGGIAAAGLMGWLLTPGNVDWSGRLRPAPGDVFELGYRGDPRQAFGYAFEDIAVTTELGAAPGWLVPAEAPSPLWAIYMHGIGGLRENGYRQLSVLRDAGIPTLLMSYRNDEGAPASPDRFHSFGLSEWKDLDAAVSWVLQRGAERVMLVADSMGAGIAGQYLLRGTHTGTIAALVLDAPALDFPAVLDGQMGAWKLPLASVVGAIAFRASALVRPDVSRAVSVSAVEGFPGPVFIAHGSGDRLVPVTISDRVAKARTGTTVYLRTKADHLQSWKEDPGRYRAELLVFLRGVA